MNSIIADSNNKLTTITIGIYYSTLLMIAVSWGTGDLEYLNSLVRFIFSLLFVLPFFKYPYIAPSAITIFISIESFSISSSGYLTTEVRFYLLLSFILYIYTIWQRNISIKSNKGLLVFSIIVFLSNLINLSFEYNFLLMLLTALLLGKMFRNKNDILLMEIAFVIITLCLSIYTFVFFKDYFLISVLPKEIDRVFWRDPNYMGCILSLGIIISFYYLINPQSKINFPKFVFIVVIISGLISIGILASRGAFMSLIIPVIYILYKKSNSLKSILLIIVLLGIGLLILSKLHLFDQLIERFNEDSLITGTNRTEIWNKSLNIFKNSNIIKLLIGGGGSYSLNICGRAMGEASISPHNNYLEILYDYGIIGLLTFISILFFWIKNNLNNTMAIALVLALIISCLTLSPLMYLPFWSLIILIENQKLKLD